MCFQQTATFRDRVRARDRRCVVTDMRVPGENYVCLDAMHIFPLAHLDVGKFSPDVEVIILIRLRSGAPVIGQTESKMIIRI
jgi:hypothetical protein